MADGFLGRWARRKQEVREGKAVEAEPAEVAGAPPPQPSPGGGGSAEHAPSPQREEGGGEGLPPEPPPTLDDVQLLTPQSDFKRFVGADVAPEVKNAALKKLFADPHFNVMDRLDIYIDDYSKPDPMPESMLRSLASAKFLGLFRDEDPEAEPSAGAVASTDGLAPQSVAQSGPPAAEPAAPEVPDAHPDLRLQQDDAAEGGEPGHRAG